MQKISYFLLFVFVISFSIAKGQSDSLVLSADQLGFENVEINDNLFNTQKVSSASRTLKEVSDLPFTILIISKEEIHANGYTTLVDVLKMAPGIRVSQPGSALEGETFLMRGLKGNTYTKILINGIPVKPFGLIGFPIGAQLPIRQAERIEIIYGPGVALYGADANAGIINIIIGHTKKPLIAQTNLSIGSNGYSNMDVFFGGKIGKGKNTINFNFFGSGTNWNDRRTTFEYPDLYDPQLYANSDLYLQSPNFRQNDGGVIINNLPHASRLIGLSFKYKMFSGEIEAMTRVDHSAIGLHPVAVSYFNPSTITGERILNSKVSLSKTFKRWSFDTTLGYRDYYMNPRSSVDYVVNTLREVSNQVILNEAFNPEDFTFDAVLYDSLSTQLHNKYFSGTRFSAARSVDFHIDQSINIFLFKNFEFTFGGQLSFSSATPQINYAGNPLYLSLFGISPFDSEQIPFLPVVYNTLEANMFTQTYLTLNKINIIGGFQYYYNSRYGRSINPRYTVVYKPLPSLGIRAVYGEAFRSPSTFYHTNSYLINSGEAEAITQIDVELDPEKTKSYEFGLRWSPSKKVAMDVSYFFTETKNLITSNFFQNSPNPQETLFALGYFNFGNAEMELLGIQSNFTFKNFLPQNKLAINFNYTFSKGKQKSAANLFTFSPLYEVPRSMLKARITYRPFKNISITSDNIYMSAVDNGYFEFIPDDLFELKNIYTMDLLFRFNLSRNFSIYWKYNNLFNRRYAGLNATNTPDDLFYNPQELRTFRLGMSYRMN